MGVNDRTHTYHAEASILHGNLHLPLKQEIPAQSYLKLKEHGGYLSQDSDRYRLEGLFYYTSAYTQVTGNPETKPGHGFATLATSVVENLNILDVVTCDRVVSQIATEHPLVGYVPSITFLGTRFENLKIAGHRVDVDIDPHPFWEEPEEYKAEDESATEEEKKKKAEERVQKARERDLGRVKTYGGFHQPELCMEELPGDLPESYPELEADESVDPNLTKKMCCSLVKESKIPSLIKGRYPGRAAKHVIDIPHFGKIYLATLCVEHHAFDNNTGVPKQTRVNLTMLRVKMGCIATGSAGVCSARTNGITRP